MAAGDPVISVDAKKKEPVGPYYRDGRSWRRRGDPVRVRDHDFADRELGRVVPYGIYDIAANRGFVSVGTSHDTAAFAVAALRLWWQREGSARYPRARRLLVVCDAGGSNSARCRLWKDQLAVLAAETGLQITVCHFPPGTSKWNKIEHRLFCHITRTWRARPLMTREDAVAGIAATVTAGGLKCTAVLDDGDYPDGVEVSDAQMTYLEDRVLDRGGFHGEWNYAVLPAPRPAPEPDPGPGPARPGRVPAAVLNHPAMTGLRAEDLTALAQALEVPFEARLQQRNYTLRRGPRVNAVRTSRPHANRRLGITDHLLALRLRDHLDLPVQAIAALLGAGPAPSATPPPWPPACWPPPASPPRPARPPATSPAPPPRSWPTPPRPHPPHHPGKRADHARPLQNPQKTSHPRHTRDNQLNNRRGLFAKTLPVSAGDSFNGQEESIAQQPYIDMQANSAGRMYFYLGSPNAPYYDFIEFTVGAVLDQRRHHAGRPVRPQTGVAAARP